MAGPARAGVLIYALDLGAMSTFYEQLLGARVLHADAEHRVLQSPDAQLIVHAIPAPFRDDILVKTPPEPREQQALKPFYTVVSLAAAQQLAEQLGGRICGPLWPGPGMRVGNVCDPEGNIVQLRELTSS